MIAAPRWRRTVQRNRRDDPELRFKSETVIFALGQEHSSTNMSIFRNIKSLFIVDKSDGKESAPQPANPRVEDSQDTLRESPKGRSGRVDQKFADILIKAMQSKNIDGFDYLEFKQSLRSLKDMQMDEGTRYKSAFAMAKTLGATPEMLVQSAAFYVDVLKKEEAKFEEALLKQREVKVLSKSREIESLEANIAKKEQHIQQLKKEIEQGRQKVQMLLQEKEEAAENMESTKNDFIASYNTIVGQIREDMQKIKEHL